jgi:hypothetical protein
MMPTNGIKGRVPDARNQEHGADCRRGNAKDVRVEEHQIHREQFPEHGGGRVAKSVADFLAQAEFHG